MIDTDTPFSDGWWVLRLSNELEKKQKRLEELDAWFRGDPPLPEGAEGMREAYLRFQKKARTNFAELVVEAATGRMTPVGFRTAAPGDDAGDRDAMQVWSENRMNVEAADVHTWMLAFGEAYVIVGQDEDGRPVITGEDPRQVVTIHDPARKGHVRAGLKMFHDPEAELDLAYLYLPGRVVVAAREVRRSPKFPRVRFVPSSWSWLDERGGNLPFKLVPVVRFQNRRGVGEFEPHLDLLGRINHQILQRMVIATMQAFRQRAIRNAPLKDKDGNVIDYNEILVADPGAFWALPKDAEVWESGQVDLTPLLSAVEHDVRHLAAVTQRPMTVFNPESVNQSAEGAALAREALVFVVLDRIARATESWRDVMSLSFLFLKDEIRAERAKIEILWDDPRRPSLGEKADAESKASALPLEFRLRNIWGSPPDEIDRVAKLAEEEAAASKDDLRDFGGQFAPKPDAEPAPAPAA